MKRFLLLVPLVAAAVLVPIHPVLARAVEYRLVLPRWAVSSSERDEARHQQRELSRQATSTKEPVKRAKAPRKRRAAPARRGPARPARSTPSREQAQPRAVSPEVIFAALKLFRVNQRAMMVCDRIAVRRGSEPPPRVRFRLRVNRAGGARVSVAAPQPFRPEVARCYRMLAASWSYPAVGRSYSVVLSRITPRR